MRNEKTVLQKSKEDTSDSDFAMVSATRALLAANDSAKNEKWVYDTGATIHICHRKEAFESFVPNLGWIQVGNSACICSCGTGNVRIRTGVNHNTYLIVLKDVTYAPEMMFNLTSKSRVRRAGFQVISDDDNTNPSRETTKIVHKATGRTAILCIKSPDGLDEALLSVKTENASVCINFTLWHRRLFHVSKETIHASRELANGLPDVSLKNDEKCAPCHIAKLTKTPRHKLHTTSSNSLLDRVFSDLVGPISSCSINEGKYIVTLLDEYSAYSMVRCLQRKSMTGNAAVEMISRVDIKFSMTV